jgi:hypothetical protein
MGFARSVALVTVAAAVLAGKAAAGPMLTGSVSYDPGTQLYTYSYVLDDRAAAGPVSHFYVRVLTDMAVGSLTPDGSTTAPPYYFGTYTGTGPVSHSEFPGGTYFGWEAGLHWQDVTAGVKSGFSVTSRYAPSDETVDNYYLWSNEVATSPGGFNNAIQEFGRVVAPDFSRPLPVRTPEPATLSLAGLGLAGLGLTYLRRRSAARAVSRPSAA